MVNRTRYKKEWDQIWHVDAKWLNSPFRTISFILWMLELLAINPPTNFDPIIMYNHCVVFMNTQIFKTFFCSEAEVMLSNSVALMKWPQLLSKIPTWCYLLTSWPLGHGRPPTQTIPDFICRLAVCGQRHPLWIKKIQMPAKIKPRKLQSFLLRSKTPIRSCRWSLQWVVANCFEYTFARLINRSL